MIDLEIKKTFKELRELLCPKAIKKLEGHLTSLGSRILELQKSRDNWKSIDTIRRRR